jgi:hypothetical protein
MSRVLVTLAAACTLIWSACHHAGKPTPYSGGPGFPTTASQGNYQNATPPPEDAGVEDAAPADAQAESTLVGYWQAGEQSIDIRADNILLINGKPFTYALGPQTLFVEGPDGSAASYPFQLNGDVLIVTVNNEKVTYARRAAVDAGARPAK